MPARHRGRRPRHGQDDARAVLPPGRSRGSRPLVELAARTFPEESYDIGDLADFWLAALHHLADATGQERWSARADELREDEPDVERSAAYALAALLDFCQEEDKRLILFVENLDLLFGQLRNEGKSTRCVPR